MKGIRKFFSRSGDRSKIRLWAVLFWLTVWQLAAMAVGQRILLASPVSVIATLFTIIPTADFWLALAFSFIRITGGFFLACVTGLILAALSARYGPASDLITPLMSVIKSVPVASFVIIVLIWLPSRNLSVFISFLIVTPVIYSNGVQGIREQDKKLSEMAAVFEISKLRRFRFITLPQIFPFFRSACAVSLGLCWKSGIAAEVIGLPDGSIGERLYQAKIYLETPELLAWTLVIVLISIGFEKLFLLMLDTVKARLEKA